MDSNSKKKNSASAYSKTQVFTASKEALLLMLYDAAIRFIRKAILATTEKNSSEKSLYIGKTMNIVTELQATLNHQAEAQIAGQLEGLYDFVQDRLLKAARDNEVSSLEEALNIFTTLRNAWDEAIQSLKPKPTVEPK